MPMKTTSMDAESAEQPSKDTGKDETNVPADFVSIRTILPLRPLGPPEKDPVLVTERLFLRPIVRGDLEAVHALRSRPLPMKGSLRGTPDENMDQTREFLDAVVPPPGVDRRRMLYALCLQQEQEDGTVQCGELIGVGGAIFVSDATGWPEIGYMLHDEYWRKGYMTEFVRGFVKIYTGLPRPAEPQLERVKRQTLSSEDLAGSADTDDGVPVVEEKLTVIVGDHNAGSIGVVRNAGFKEIGPYEEDSGAGTGVPYPVRVYEMHPSRLAVAGKTA